MRRVVLALFLLTTVLAAGAQQQPVELKLSQSVLTLKITDPLKQFDAFSPLLENLADVAAIAGPASPQIDPPALREHIAKVIQRPGVDTKGDFWFVMLPSAPAAPAAPALPAAAGADKPAAHDAQVAKPPCALLVPLADAQAFTQYQHTQHGTLPGVVCGNYALLSADAALQKITRITFDLPLHTKRDIALSLQLDKGDFTFAEPGADKGPSPLLQRFSDVLQNYQRNLQQIELGMSMAGNDCSAEYYFTPKPGGALQHCLTTQQNDQTALEYAGYLPTDLACCSASGPMLDGAPGTARIMMDFATGILGIFLPPEQSDGFGKSMEALMTQCSQGRALGITATPAKTPAGATLVEVYHVTNAQDAKTAMHNFLQQVQTVRSVFFGGTLEKVFTLELRPEAETLANTPVDVVVLTITQNENPKKADTPASPPPLHFAGRIAYLNDKMLLTFGGDSKGQMEALITRINNHTAGFTSSARFQAIKATLPEKIHGFEVYSTLDLARAGVNTFAPESAKSEALKLLSIFPPQRVQITAYQELQAGLVHGEVRLPGSQLDFFFSVLKTVMEMKGNAATTK